MSGMVIRAVSPKQLKSGLFALALACVLPAPANAWEKGSGAFNQKYNQECAACHLAFSPAFLSAGSWHAVMNGLDRHFGFDVSLSAAEKTEIEHFLASNAGSRKTTRDGKPLLRITETQWFVREHTQHLPADAWKHPGVKSAVNCIACHSAADKGDYSERTLKLPKGMKEQE